MSSNRSSVTTRPRAPKPVPLQRSRQRLAPQTGARLQLVVMAKVPVAGRVKTRLARGIGAVSAVKFYRSSLRATVARLSAGARWQTIIAVSPDGAVDWPGWPVDVARVGQGSGDLGQRMQRLFDGLPAGPVVIVGSDTPEVAAADIARAFDALGNHDAVIGPSPDGGYWLIGLKRMPRVPKVFANVRWSAPETLADTLANLDSLDVAMLRELDDVDEAEDLRRFGADVRRLGSPQARS